MAKIIETHNIAKVYKMGNNIVRALQSVTINIDRGEYVAFMGPSGSGKSTLMNIVGCLDSPTEGTYMLNNHMVSELRAAAARRIEARTSSANRPGAALPPSGA